MSNNRTIDLNQIEPSIYFVKGVLSFSRLTKKIDGEELLKDQQRRSSMGLIPINKPYTSATIYNATIMQVNPAQKTPAEIYGEESFYHSKTKSGYTFTANNKSNGLPWIGVSTNGGKTVDQIIPEGELANDLNVILVVRIFKGKMNNGQSLDGVIVLDPIKYYTNTGQNLAQYGITFNPVETTPETDPQTVGPAPMQTPVPQTNTMPASQPMNSPFGNAPANPFSNQPSASPFGQPSPVNGYPNNGIQYNPN